MESILKNKTLNTLITIFGALAIALSNTNDYFILRVVIKTIFIIILVLSMYIAFKSQWYNSTYFLLFGSIIIYSSFFMASASKKIFGLWNYSENYVLGSDYQIEIKEDSTFSFKEISQKTGRTLYEASPGFIKVITEGKGISKKSQLIEFNFVKAATKKYLVFNGLTLEPPPFDPDYGTFDYFPFTPLNDFKGNWTRE